MSDEMTTNSEGGGEAVTAGGRATPDAAEGVHPSVSALRDSFGDAVLRHEVVAGDEHVVFVGEENSFEILRWLRDEPDHLYNFLSDVTAVDYGEGRPIQVVYQLYSIPHRHALRVKVELPVSDLEIDSVVPLWQCANWLEREVYDMFGVNFRGHPDLRRILMPANYAEGHPLRKDFPLRGRFSRAEQTRRALAQEPEDHYVGTDFGPGRDPQVVPWPEIGGEPVPVRSPDSAEDES
ncbi:MAG: NADH-quinone oxidoreductase subunit C [Gemmatimonadota bacterium]